MLVCLLAVSCSKSKQADSKSQSKNSNSSEPAVELKVKWTLGKKNVQRMAIVSKVDMGSGRQQATDMSWDYSLNTSKQLDTGGHEVELEFLTTKMEAKAGDRVYMSFDSAHDDGKDKKDPITPALRKMVGGKLRYILNADNKVERLDGYDDFMVRIARGSKNSEVLKGMFSQDTLKHLCGWTDVLPDHPVRPGDTWKYAMNMNLYGMANMTIDGKFTFINWEDHGGHKCVKLDFDGTISGKGGGAAPFTIEKGRMHGSSWFDPEQGVGIASDNDQTMTINVKQRGNSMSQQIIQNVTTTLVE